MVLIELKSDHSYEIRKNAPKATFDSIPYQLDDKSSMSTVDEDNLPPTNWRKIGIAGLMWFLCAVENTVIGMSEWPYMHQIDKAATTQFFGFVTSSSRTGHAFFALAFSYWGYKLGKCRWPLMVGRLMALLGVCMYLCVEFIPENRRYWMLACYFLFGVGSSSTTLLRGYIADVSHPKDRSRAYAVSTVAHLISIVCGPIIQLCFTRIKYPGYEIIPGKLRFNIYSAPISCALLTNIIAIYVVAVFWVETGKERPQKAKIYSQSIIGKVKEFLGRKDIKWPLILVCWYQKMMSHLSIVAIATIASPLFMMAFNWDGQKTVLISSISHIFVGVLSITVSCIYIFGKLGHYVSARFSYLIGLLISVLLYVLTYPWPTLSQPLPLYNATTGSGCDPNVYSWCFTEKAMPAVFWIPIVVLVMGVGLPFAMISIDTIYSKVLGDVDQNVMQGVYIFIEDIMMIGGPIYASTIFTEFGQSWLWFSNVIFTAIAIFVWIAFYPILAPYK
ncbi:unnamed protein product, partial [Mesorhabditis belari]|uniref:Membrane transporter n=1 Tax=Mesorhabditis belari TaxID=2138241 RepID=A0AAF3ETR4_9BILA